MVRDKESCHKVIKLLGGGVLGLPWDSEHDLIPFHIRINLSQKKGKIRLGPELSLETIGEIDDIQMTRRVLVSQFYAIQDARLAGTTWWRTSWPTLLARS